MSRWDPYEDDDPLMGVLSKKAAKEGFPLSGVVTLTARCNLRCVHCYITPTCEKYPKELNTAEFKNIIDEIADIGCLNLVLTGGEPLVRPDFKELYSYARKSGFILTLFSNATLMTDEIVALLKDLPPRHVDVSIYGATEETYESITGMKGAYRRCIDGIELLLKNDVKVRLKSVLMKQNINEFSEMKKLAAEYELPYRVDPVVFGRFSGDTTPLDLRISPSVGVECEAQMEGFIDNIRRMVDEEGKVPVVFEKLYNCGAGRSTFSVTETGMLRPCLMITDIEADLKENTFKTAWKDVVEKVRAVEVPDNYECKGCALRNVCGYCPPLGKYSTVGDVQEKKYFCEIGHARSKLL